MTISIHRFGKKEKVSTIKLLLLATLILASAGITSCTSEGVGASDSLKRTTNPILLTQKAKDSTGGQGGQTPPPRP